MMLLRRKLLENELSGTNILFSHPNASSPFKRLLSNLPELRLLPGCFKPIGPVDGKGLRG